MSSSDDDDDRNSDPMSGSDSDDDDDADNDEYEGQDEDDDEEDEEDEEEVDDDSDEQLDDDDDDDDLIVEDEAWDDGPQQRQGSMAKAEPGQGFAAAMSKILGSKVGANKDPVLAHTPDASAALSKEKLDFKLKSEIAKQRKMLGNRNHYTVEQYGTRDLERKLTRLATKGVVQLFNVIKKHQAIHGVSEDAVENATLSKDRFLELLEKSSSVAKSVDPKRFSELDQQQAKPSREKQTKSSWKVLQDDFLGHTKMKNWDEQELELEEEEQQHQQEAEQEFDWESE